MEIGKYFLAILIPEPFQSQVMDMKKFVSENYASKGALRSPAHITLHMPYEWNAERENEMTARLEKFTFNERISVSLKNFFHFEQRVIFVDVVPNENLEKLYREIVRHAKSELHLLNEANNMRGFHPHVTIAFRDLKKEQFRKAWEHFSKQEYNTKFEVTSFYLMKHHPGHWEAHREFKFLK